jgi:hypothetical protein
MEKHAYEVAKARALALCRAAAADPIPFEDALAELGRLPREGEAVAQEEILEAEALELIFGIIGTLQQIGAALGPAPEEPAPVVIHRPQAGAVVVPKPSNVR